MGSRLASASPRNLLEIQILGSTPDLQDPSIWRWGSQSLCLNKPSSLRSTRLSDYRSLVSVNPAFPAMCPLLNLIHLCVNAELSTCKAVYLLFIWVHKEFVTVLVFIFASSGTQQTIKCMFKLTYIKNLWLIIGHWLVFHHGEIDCDTKDVAQNTLP